MDRTGVKLPSPSMPPATLRRSRSFHCFSPRRDAMQGMRRLGLTGAPGSGKTTIAEVLREGGFDILTVESLASENECIDAEDPRDGARPIDIVKLKTILVEAWADPPKKMTIVDGHLSHLLPVGGVIVLRCDPEILRDRLVSRDYSDSKVDSNVEWEFIGGAWNEYNPNIPWTEFETSKNSPVSIVGLIRSWISDGFKHDAPDTAIDWVEGGTGDV